MKLQISLNNTSFFATDEAYELLRLSLGAVARDQSDLTRDVVMEDLERRLCEYFQTKGMAANVLSFTDIKEAFEAVGFGKYADKVEMGDIETEDGDDKVSGDGKGKSDAFDTPVGEGVTRKRFFRETSNGVLGGVCSGFAEWIGASTAIVRIIVAVSLIFLGQIWLIPIYLILWICVPNATTREQRELQKGKKSGVMGQIDISGDDKMPKGCLKGCLVGFIVVMIVMSLLTWWLIRWMFEFGMFGY